MTQAWVFDEFGGPEVLRLAEHETPASLQGNELRIRMHASALNPIDAKIRNGTSWVAQKRRADRIPFPWGIGFDMSGEVLEAGPETSFSPGDLVFGPAGYVYAPCACAREVVCEDTYMAAAAGCDLTQAAALPIAGVTALDMLPAIESHGGREILLTGASGGVGHILVSLLRLRGYQVTALVSRGNFELAERQGAAECLDYARDQSAHHGRYAVVIDMLGGELGKSFCRFLRSGGLFITVPTYSRDELIAHARDTVTDVTATGTLAQITRSKLEYLRDLVTSGQLQVHVSHAYEFGELTEAHRQIESTHTPGKIVLMG